MIASTENIILSGFGYHGGVDWREQQIVTKGFGFFEVVEEPPPPPPIELPPLRNSTVASAGLRTVAKAGLRTIAKAGLRTIAKV
jgi:hypothetical protein